MSCARAAELRQRRWALTPALPARSSYRSCLMALQKFYLDHQEYDFVYNWEMDVRYIGNYLDYFEGVEGA